MKSTGLKPKTSYAIAFGVWLLAVLIAFLATKELGLVGGITLAFVISMIFMWKNYNSAWAGEVIEIKTERIRINDDEGHHHKEVVYAIIKLDNGKNKKTPIGHGWEVGDRLEKRKGEAVVRNLTKES